jgi:hypothetical protein
MVGGGMSEKKPSIIDVEFEVITPAREVEPPEKTWPGFSFDLSIPIWRWVVHFYGFIPWAWVVIVIAWVLLLVNDRPA